MKAPAENLSEVLKKIKKNKNGNIVQKSDIVKKFFSSGSLIIDRLINGYGYPTRRIIEIFGQPGTGKTTLAIHAMAEMQKMNSKKIIYFDIERTLNLDYVEKIGVNLKNVVILWPKMPKKLLIC